MRTLLKQYNCYESATIWYTNHQYLAKYSEISNNLQELLLMFCNYAVRSCGTWRNGPCQSSRNVLSISDLELYVAERSTDVCDPVTEGLWNPISSRLNGWTSLVHMCYQYKMKLDAMHPTLVGEDMIIITFIKILSRGWPAEKGKEQMSYPWWNQWLERFENATRFDKLNIESQWSLDFMLQLRLIIVPNMNWIHEIL